MNQPNKSRAVSKGDLNAFGRLLTPSWLSGLVVVVASLAIVFGAIGELHYSGSAWQQLLAAQHGAGKPLSVNSQTLSNNITASTFVSIVPLLIFWAGIGLIVYWFAAGIVGAFQNLIDLKQEMNYVHANRNVLIRQSIIHLLVRLIVLVVWIVYIRYSLHFLLPYVIAMAYAGGGLGWLKDSAYIAGAVGVSIVGLHLHSVMLRLLLLKPRLFGQPVKL